MPRQKWERFADRLERLVERYEEDDPELRAHMEMALQEEAHELRKNRCGDEKFHEQENDS